MDRDQVHRPPLRAPGLQRRPSEQGESAGVVGVVAVDVAVEAGPIEGGRAIHEPEAVPVCLKRPDHDLAEPAGRKRIVNRELERVHGHRGGDGDAGVAGQEDLHLAIHRTRDPTERPRQRVHDVAETAGLGPGLAFRRDEQHLHGARS